ncbi:hypothetical protein [Castellaniella sp.]|uniref:hypothetical protein n=1 Tax=Castellaniella sp. TaxID=1955812 RepID=UPI002AFEB9F9|nr:hypothetical protein [Castellaniella sp.]
MARLERGQKEPIGFMSHWSTNRSASPSVSLPDIPQELLDYLDVTFPDRIDPSWQDMEDVREAQGARKVIDHLRQLKEDMENS